MGIMARLGKKQLEVMSNFLGSAACYGLSGGLLLCYFTDWKAVLQYVPYWNGKYSKEDAA